MYVLMHRLAFSFEHKVDYIKSLLAKFVRRKVHNPTFLEAFFTHSIDYWNRLRGAIQLIPSFSKVLEVGAGGPGVSDFLTSPSHDVTLLDVSISKLRILEGASIVNADANNLPFKDDIFDAVVSIDTIEHIRRNRREQALHEMRRVCKKIIVIYCPINDEAQYLGRTYDILFSKIYRRVFNKDEPNTAEHINCVHPRINELLESLPNAKITGTQNCHIWLLYMVFQCAPIIRHLTWFLYILFLKKFDNKPPYHACQLRYVKRL